MTDEEKKFLVEGFIGFCIGHGRTSGLNYSNADLREVFVATAAHTDEQLDEFRAGLESQLQYLERDARTNNLGEKIVLLAHDSVHHNPKIS